MDNKYGFKNGDKLYRPTGKLIFIRGEGDRPWKNVSDEVYSNQLDATIDNCIRNHKDWWRYEGYMLTIKSLLRVWKNH